MLGSEAVPSEAYYRIHTVRARDNFAVSGRPVNPRITRAIVMVKKAAAKVNGRQGFISRQVAAGIQSACDEILQGQMDQHFIVDAYQGGAGTGYVCGGLGPAVKRDFAGTRTDDEKADRCHSAPAGGYKPGIPGRSSDL